MILFILMDNCISLNIMNVVLFHWWTEVRTWQTDCCRYNDLQQKQFKWWWRFRRSTAIVQRFPVRHVTVNFNLSLILSISEYDWIYLRTMNKISGAHVTSRGCFRQSPATLTSRRISLFEKSLFHLNLWNIW